MSKETSESITDLVEEDQRVSFSQRMFIGITKSGSDMFSVLYAGALFGFYVDILNMDPINYGTVMIIFAIWNAINDPVFGYMSDKKRMDKRGKRAFFIKFSIPFYFIGFLMFWLAPQGWSQISLFIFLLVSLFIFDTGLTIAGLNISAIQTDQTSSTNERTRIMLISMLLSMIPVGIASMTPNLVLTSTTLSKNNMSLIFISIGVVALILMIYGSIKLREKSLEGKDSQPLPILAAIKETFKSKSFLFFVIFSFMMNAVALNLIAVIPLYYKYVFQLDSIQVLVITVATGVFYIPTLLMFERVQKKIGLRKTYFIAMGLMFLGFVGLYFAESVVFMAVCYGVSLCMTTVWWLLVNPLIGDIADEDELKTNSRREGMFFGTNALITKPAPSLIIFIFTIIIEACGYNSELAAQSSEAIRGLRLGVGILPLAFLVLGFIALFFYPLHSKKLNQVKLDLNQLHKKRGK
jgi:GPH family glycoside/pentoside/hexuronide:cation symporter